MPVALTPLDYGRSFLVGRWPANEVRFWIESRTRVVDARRGVVEDYLQCGACKSEDTFAARNLFYPDNYDFTPIFGPEYSLIFRRKAWLNPNYRETKATGATWAGLVRHVHEAAGAVELADAAAVVDATLRGEPIVAQTEIWDDATGLRAIIECPVKTLNTRRDPLAYQVDTGPVAFPDLAGAAERLVDRLALAFVAFNAPGFADFVIEAPVSARAPDAAATDAVPVHHYSRRVSLPARNRLLAVPA